MRAIVTVIGKDRVGIIASVTNLLSSYGVNVLDISQTVLQEYFTMIMLVDASACTVPFAELASRPAPDDALCSRGLLPARVPQVVAVLEREGDDEPL